MPAAHLSDLLRPEAVLVPLSADGPEEAVRLLVSVLDPRVDRRELEAAVLAREKAGSTGLGGGVAVPHAKSARLAEPLLAVGLARVPLDFGSADGAPVDLVFLLAAPLGDPKSHLRALAALSRLGSDAKLLSRLRRAPSAAALYSLLADLPV